MTNQLKNLIVRRTRPCGYGRFGEMSAEGGVCRIAGKARSWGKARDFDQGELPFTGFAWRCNLKI